MKVKVKKFKPNFEKSCERLKNFSTDYYDRKEPYKAKSEEFYNTNGFHYEDCWGLDSWFAINMTPRLIYFKEHSAGYPSEFYEKYPEQEAIAKWNKILDSMIAAFQIISEDEFTNYDARSETLRKCKERIVKRGLRNFAKYYNNLWD